RATGLHWNWTPFPLTIMDIVSRVEAKNIQVNGDVAALTPQAPPIPSHAWPQASIYFRNVDGEWKLDFFKTFKFEYKAIRRKSVPGETQEQVYRAGMTWEGNK